MAIFYVFDWLTGKVVVAVVGVKGSMNFEETSRLISSQYLKDLQDAQINNKRIERMTPDRDYSLENKSEPIEPAVIKHPT